MSNLWDKANKVLTEERRLAREGECGEDYWIIARPNGKRIVKPYHCGTCDKCLKRKSLELKSYFYSLGWMSDISYVKAPPVLIDRLVEKLDTSDYARFPCEDGSDYLFGNGTFGTDVFKADIDWIALLRRRKGTRKSGRLITYTKKKEGDLIELRNVRASSKEDAILALKKTIEVTEKNGMRKEDIFDFQQLEIHNNFITTYCIKKLEELDSFVFDHKSKCEYSLPVKFEFTIIEHEEGEINAQ